MIASTSARRAPSASQPGGDSSRLRHAADARRQVEHALALGDGELTEQKEGFARLGGNPVGIPASAFR